MAITIRNVITTANLKHQEHLKTLSTLTWDRVKRQMAADALSIDGLSSQQGLKSVDRIWQKRPGTGNENVGTEKRTGSEKGSVGPAQGIPGKKKGAGKVSGKVGTGNGQPMKFVQMNDHISKETCHISSKKNLRSSKSFPVHRLKNLISALLPGYNVARGNCY